MPSSIATTSNFCKTRIVIPSFSCSSSLGIEQTAYIKPCTGKAVLIQSALHSPTQPHQSSKTTKQQSHSKATTPQKWNLLQKAAATALDMAEKVLLSLEATQPLSKTVDPAVQIAGNFAPVPEKPVRHNLPVVGTIPDRS